MPTPNVTHIMKRLFTSSLTAMTIGLTGSLTAAPANAAEFCQCVIYVKNRLGISVAMGDAKNMIYSLPNQGFRQTPEPVVGSVVVMQPSFPGSDGTYGHVGFVASVDGAGRIAVQGSNQGNGGNSTDANCNNVNVINFGTSVRGRSDVSFWVQGSAPAPANASNVRTVNFSGTTAPDVVRLHSDQTTNTNTRTGTIPANQRVNFDAWTYGEVVSDFWTNQSDARWYRITGSNNWVSSAVINGNAPGSKPMP
jgi:surface antigen